MNISVAHYSTHNEKTPTDLLTWEDLKKAAKDPATTEKGQTACIHPSNAPGKTKDVVQENNEMTLLWADIDTGNQSLSDVKEKIEDVGFTEGFDAFLIYSTASAWREKKGVLQGGRWRVLFPLSKPIPCTEWLKLQEALAKALDGGYEAVRIQQILYLPTNPDGGRYKECVSHGTVHLDPDRLPEQLKIVLDVIEQEQAEEEEKARTAPLRTYKSSVSQAEGGIIDKVNDSAPCIQDVLEAHGYKQAGRRWLSPHTTSGIPGVILLPNSEPPHIYCHHSSDPLADGHAHDKFSVLTILEYGGDPQAAVRDLAPQVDPEGQKERQREHMQEQERESIKIQFGCTVTPEAQKLADRIHQTLLGLLQIDPKKNPEAAESIKPDAERITRMINGAFWSGSSSKLFLINHTGDLVRFLGSEGYKFLAQTFGAVVDSARVEELASKIDTKEKFINYCKGAAGAAVMDHLKYYNQRESIEWRVDMFAQHSRMELLEDKARIVLTHKAFEEFNKPERYAEIVADYRQHFTRFDEFLQFIVMSRFALDRKKSHLWILGSSDWGKGFLMGMLRELRACVETSMKEVETMFEGKPVGRTPEDFKRALVLHIDEFKTVKSELKQLQSEITLAPKHQLTCSVEIFAKVFTSAESVASLVGENGVEDQFANRMSIFEERGNITKRPLFQQVGNARYFRAVLAYVSRYLNTHISDMQKLGREKAEATAEQWLDDFIARYGLDTKYERFSDSLPALADEVVYFLAQLEGLPDDSYKAKAEDPKRLMKPRIIRNGLDLYLKCPGNVVDEYLERHFDHSEITSIKRKKKELYALMSADGSGIKHHSVNNRKIKAVKLKDLP